MEMALEYMEPVLAVGFAQMGDNASAIAAAFGGGLPPGISGTSDRCTVLVSNLDADDVTQEEIVSHLEEHGIIVNTKLFEMNGKKQALVLFEYEEQATEALGLKLATSLGSSTIRISFSQLQTI